MTTLSDVYANSEKTFGAGRYEEALRGYLAVVEAAPRFTRARYRIADCLLNLGDRERAKEVYKGLAWHYIKAGYPLLGLVVCKMVIALDPTYDDMLYILAELYSSESDRTGEVDLPGPLPLPDGAPAPGLPNLDPSSLLRTAAERAADTDGITDVPERFPLIPLFSHLSEDAFMRVLGSLRLRRHTHGEQVVREGDGGDSFFMLADGVVVVSKTLQGKETTLAHLYQGAVFGEMALVSNAPRAATVTAQGDVDVLELSRHDLEQHAGELESVKMALRKFTRGRFLANLAATSPLFCNLDKAERRSLMRKFRPRKVHGGDILIEEKDAGLGLYLVLRGEFSVTTKTSGSTVELARLTGGDVFGETSLLRDAPTNATVTAVTIGEVLFLPREDFAMVLDAHPEVRSTLSSMSEERLKERALATGGRLITDDSEIMV